MVFTGCWVYLRSLSVFFGLFFLELNRHNIIKKAKPCNYFLLNTRPLDSPFELSQ